MIGAISFEMPTTSTHIYARIEFNIKEVDAYEINILKKVDQGFRDSPSFFVKTNRLFQK